MKNIYTQIDNEILSAIYSSKLTASQIKILLFILRQTCGYHQKGRRLSSSYISANTNIELRYVKLCLKKLINCNILKKTGTETNTNVIEINFDTSSWKINTEVVCKTPCTADHPNSGPQDTEDSGLQTTHIKKEIKKNIKKEKEKEIYKQNDKKSKGEAYYKNQSRYKNKPSVFSPEGRSYDLEAYENSSIFD